MCGCVHNGAEMARVPALFRCNDCDHVMRETEIICATVPHPKDASRPIYLNQCPECGECQNFTNVCDEPGCSAEAVLPASLMALVEREVACMLHSHPWTCPFAGSRSSNLHVPESRAFRAVHFNRSGGGLTKSV
jgi:hypothetical protein